VLALPAGAGAHAVSAPVSATALGPNSCPGAAIQPTEVITGEFGAELQGSFVLLPFRVPMGTTAVRVKYCWDPPIGPFVRHTLDLGLYQSRSEPGALYGPREFRGWGGSSHPDVIVSPEGFKSEAEYVASPRTNVPGKTTRGFLPGPIVPGEWAVELGVAAVVTQALGDPDGKVGWRVEIELSNDPAFADEPYEPAPYDTDPTDAAEIARQLANLSPRAAKAVAAAAKATTMAEREAALAQVDESEDSINRELLLKFLGSVSS